jgi:hypothetical protein
MTVTVVQQVFGVALLINIMFFNIVVWFALNFGGGKMEQ